VPILEARAVTKHYAGGAGLEVRALDGVSLTIERGTWTTITGPSGSGKTTLLALLGALERPTAGQVLFDGRDLGGYFDAELARARRRMGFVFQDFSLIPNLSAIENVTYPLIPRGIPRGERLRRARELLLALGLAERERVSASALSGGEQQRVAIARALAGQPELVLADEPTSNLDPESAATLLALLRELHAEGTTLVLASHDPSVIGLSTQSCALLRGQRAPSAADGDRNPGQ
jgi:putative ABC transport system ATP-binding protein